MRTLISCTWHSNKERKIEWSKRFYEERYLVNVRFQHIRKQINDYINFIYISDTNNTIYPLVEDKTIYVYGQQHEFKKHHDSFAGMAIAAQYAYSNNMHYCYIEHDCLVYGLDKAIEFGKKHSICYGYGDVSYSPEWAEQSFVFVNNEFLPEFISRLNKANMNKEMAQFPERVWQTTFKDIFTAWSFGYGRKRPIDWNQEVFYAQQLTDEEIKQFLEKE